jgi:hypothetical protein
MYEKWKSTTHNKVYCMCVEAGVGSEQMDGQQGRVQCEQGLSLPRHRAWTTESSGLNRAWLLQRGGSGWWWGGGIALGLQRSGGGRGDFGLLDFVVPIEWARVGHTSCPCRRICDPTLGQECVSADRPVTRAVGLWEDPNFDRADVTGHFTSIICVRSREMP